MVDEGWSFEHDDEHNAGELAACAACYASGMAALWPFDGEPKFKERRRDLVRAGALLMAEIGRIDRAAARELEKSR
jgi:hypothetical protein